MTDVCGALTCDVCGRSSWDTTITWYPGGAQRCAKHQLRQEGEDSMLDAHDPAWNGDGTAKLMKGVTPLPPVSWRETEPVFPKGSAAGLTAPAGGCFVSNVTWRVMKVADDQHNGFVNAVAAVDQAIVERPDDAYGQGEITCPICQGIIDYRFKRGRRMLVRMQCRTPGCFVAMT